MAAFSHRCMRSARLKKLLLNTPKVQAVIVSPIRGKRFMVPYLKEQYARRVKEGPAPVIHPSEMGCWNYDAEIYAFGKRLGEDFNEATLKTAFVHRSYIEKEEKKRQELGLNPESVSLGLDDNEDLRKKGEQLASRYIKAYLRYSYPHMFEEGICAIHDYLMSEEILSHVGSHFGMKDIILCDDYPPSPGVYVETFLALIGALEQDKGHERAEYFVRDFILPQLIGKDVSEMWEIVNPMGLLTSILTSQGREAPEPRLLWQSASKTVLSLYHVGIYSDKRLIGQSPGETVSIAEEMAARDALKNILKIADHRPSLKFGKASEGIRLDYDKQNVSVQQLQQQQQQQSLDDGVSNR